MSIVRTFFIEYDAEILPVHYIWKVAFPSFIHKQIFRKNCKMNVRTTFLCALYLIKYGKQSDFTTKCNLKFLTGTHHSVAATLLGRFLTLNINIRLGWKGLQGTNTLTYSKH